VAKGTEVVPGVDGSDEVGDDGEEVGDILGCLLEGTFGAGGGAGEEADLEAGEGAEAED
jgi:hypothetical protein